MLSLIQQDWAAFQSVSSYVTAALLLATGIGGGNLFSSSAQASPLPGTVVTVAGAGQPGFSGDGGPATQAQINTPLYVKVDAFGNLYFSDSENNRIRKVSVDGTISTIAGTGQPGFSGDGGLATQAQLDAPYGISWDPLGNLFLLDGYSRVRKISPDGIVHTIAGNGEALPSPPNNEPPKDSGPALSATFAGGSGLEIGENGDVFFGDVLYSKVLIVHPDGFLTALANVYNPVDMTLDLQGNVYAASQMGMRIYRYTTASGWQRFAGDGYRPDTGVGRFAGDGGPALQASLNNPTGVAVDSSGNVYISDTANGRIRKVTPDGIITTIAGTGKADFNGDGLPALQTNLACLGLTIDRSGNLFCADGVHHRIREIVGIAAPGILAGRLLSDWATVQRNGDLNRDGKTDVSDAVLALQAAIGLPTKLDAQVAADLNGNGRVDLADVLQILRMAVGG